MDGVEIRLGQQGQLVYQLVFDTEAVEKYESVPRADGTVRGIFDLFRIMETRRIPPFADLVVLFWACARSKNPNWSLQRARQVARFEDSGKLIAALNQAVEQYHKQYFPQSETQGEEPPAKSGDSVPLADSPKPSD